MKHLYSMSVATVKVDFAGILAEMEADKELQESIRQHQKELDQSSRSIASILNKIHSTPSDQGKKRVWDVDTVKEHNFLKAVLHTITQFTSL